MCVDEKEKKLGVGLRYKLQKTSDMALANGMTKKEQRKMNNNNNKISLFVYDEFHNINTPEAGFENWNRQKMIEEFQLYILLQIVGTDTKRYNDIAYTRTEYPKYANATGSPIHKCIFKSFDCILLYNWNFNIFVCINFDVYLHNCIHFTQVHPTTFSHIVGLGSMLDLWNICAVSRCIVYRS